jgi:hypothetical protein
MLLSTIILDLINAVHLDASLGEPGDVKTLVSRWTSYQRGIRSQIIIFLARILHFKMASRSMKILYFIPNLDIYFC